MTRIPLFAGLVLAVAACGTTAKQESAAPPETQPAAEVRRVAIPPGSQVSVGTGADGATAISIRIPDGQPDAGTYTSTSPHLAAEANSIAETLGKPGVAASMQVDGKNQIEVLTHEVTKQ